MAKFSNFLSPEFGTKSRREVPQFLEIPKFLYNTVLDKWISELETFMPKNQLDLSSRFDTIPDCDGRADR